ncbi:MAG: EamA family transporter [Oligoflexales bacterium]|nr:EamA family transporter [Oligoflexales bacterium]
MFSLKLGYFYAILAAILFGASTPASKWLLGGTSPWLLAGLLYLGSGLGLFLTLIIRKIFKFRKSEASLQKKDWGWLSGATLFGGVIAPTLLMYGLSRTDAGSASLLLNLEGVFTATLAWFVFRENFDRRILFGMISILAGSVVLSWTQDPSLSDFIGPICVSLACLSWGIDNNFTKKISASDALQISMLKGLAAGLTNIALAVALSEISVNPKMLMIAGVVGFFGYGLSLLCFVLALRQIGAARTGAYFSLAPFLGAIIAVLMGSEPMSTQLVIAGILMGYGVWLHLSENHEHEHIHLEMEHEHNHVHDSHHQHTHSPLDPPGEPHVHKHRHEKLVHSHHHFPDTHHSHKH